MSAPAPSVFSELAQQYIHRLGLVPGIPNLDAYSRTLIDLAGKDPRIVVVTSDSRGSGKLTPFGETFPDRHIEVGIAEQNLVGIAAGLAAVGKKPFATSPSSFLTARAVEQIKNDVCYSDVPVVLVGISAGVSYGALGSTHHSLHDIALLRAISNITIIVPADNVETEKAVRAAAQAEHPVFLRFGKAPMYTLHSENVDFEPGRAIRIRDGNDIAFIATGEVVVHCLLAAAYLEEYGVKARVVSMHTIKPLDIDEILDAGKSCRAVITVEEHSVHGGLGEAVAAVLLQAGICVPFYIVGIPDEETVTGSQADIFRHYGLTMESLAEKALLLLGESVGILPHRVGSK